MERNTGKWDYDTGGATDLTGWSVLGGYAKILYGHWGGDSVTLSSGEPVDFSSVDSLRLRLGTPYRKPINKQTKLVLGLAYGHELDGRQKAAANVAIVLPGRDIRGGTWYWAR